MAEQKIMLGGSFDEDVFMRMANAMERHVPKSDYSDKDVKYFRSEAVKAVKANLPKGTKVRTTGSVADDGRIVLDVVCTPPPEVEFVDVGIAQSREESNDRTGSSGEIHCPQGEKGEEKA